MAPAHYKINNENRAYLSKQPENAEEEALCREAMDICPVNAISVIRDVKKPEPVMARSNIRQTLEKYPELKDVLMDLSPKFRRMQNTAVYNTLARFANFRDAARITGLSVCEILHTINKHLGIEEELLKNMPECIQEVKEEILEENIPEHTWQESPERYIYNRDTLDEMVTRISTLPPGDNLVIISVEKPVELIKVINGLHFHYNLEKNREYRLSVFNPEQEEAPVPWQQRKASFEILDVRSMTTDPFDVIIKKAYDTPENQGFVLVQQFEPYPIINMLHEMGFEHITEQQGTREYRIYFHKKPTAQKAATATSGKVDVIIQSATPVAYPVIMKLLQSERIRTTLNIRELKVWEETEKHLAWITSGKADISFSALITVAKLRRNDILIPALFVWDNFVLLTRYKAKGFEDIRGKKIHTPLFEEAPPAKITRYLMQATGFNPEDFTFVFGKPFGRPEEIYRDFVTGRADTVILREPEASYAISILQDRKESFSVISFNEIWNRINPGFGSFPNAGLVLKGDFARNHPEQTRIFLEELRSAIEWVNAHRREAALLSFDMMRQPVNRIELFLDRVNFNFVTGEELVEKVKQYFNILNREEITGIPLDKEFLNIFRGV